MAFSLVGFVKGLLVRDESDPTKELTFEIDSAATTDTRTTVKAAQTADRTLTLPNATDTLVGKATTDILTNKTMDFSTGGTNTLVADAVDVLYDNTSSGLTATEVQGAIDEVEGRVDTSEVALAAHLVDAVDAHDASAISNVPAGTISSTDIQSAVNELDSDVQAANAALAAHLADAADAHDASAILNVPAGSIASTDVQSAINELDGDNQANTSALAAHLADATDAHDASAISNVPSGNLAATDVQSALNELQSDIDSRVAGPASATDNAIVRYDGTTGKLVQDSLVTVSDLGIVSGATQLNVDNVRLDGNTVSSTSGDLILDGADIDANTNIIKNVVNPVNPQDAATKSYVDTAVSGSGANTSLSNLTSPTSINQHLLPDSLNTRDIGGTSSNSFKSGYFGNNVGVYNGANPDLHLTNTGFIVPSGSGSTAAMNAVAGQSFAIYSSTSNANSGNVLIETGNAPLGNSGNLSFYTGTALATRGSINFNTNNFNVSNVTQGVGLPIWKKYTVSESAFTAAATSEDIELFSLPAKGVIHNVIIKHTTSFTGGSLSAFTLSVGISGNLTKYASAFDVFQATGDSVGQTSTAVDFENFSTATSIRLAATSTGGNVADATAGVVEIYVLVGVLP